MKPAAVADGRAVDRLASIAFRAMNCEMRAWIDGGDRARARVRLAEAQRYIETVEARLSRFRPESELSRLNTRSGEWVAVSPMLWAVLRASLDAARRTGWLYDPTILDALEAAGYDRSFEQLGGHPDGDHAVATAAHALAPRRRQGIAMVPRERMVRLDRGARVDLGGLAKSWAADRAADLLTYSGPCLVDAGGDIAARGAPGGLPGWPVGVADPFAPTADLAVLVVRDAGVATSGVDVRRWVAAGGPAHHIIDPRTRQPAATDLVTATVIAPSAAEANAHAVAAVVLGSREALRYLAGRPGVAALVVRDDARLLTTPGFHAHTDGRGLAR